MLPYTIQPSLEDARRTAQERGFRERVACYVTRARRDVLVFEHDSRYPDAGVQVPAGGIDPGETLEQAAAREAFEETGLENLSAPVYLGSALHDGWQPPQMQHYFWLEVDSPDADGQGEQPFAPTRTIPDAWDHFAENQYTFHHRFEPIPDAVIHWGLDAFIPELERRLNLEVTQTRNNAVPVAVCYITRVQNGVPELLILHGHPDGGVQVVAGVINDGETPEQAAIREAWEEAGLRLENPVFLGRAEYHFKGVHPDTSEPLELHEDRYFYHFITDEPKDSWDHVVSAGEDDGGKVFHQQFVRLEDARLDWKLDQYLIRSTIVIEVIKSALEERGSIGYLYGKYEYLKPELDEFKLYTKRRNDIIIEISKIFDNLSDNQNYDLEGILSFILWVGESSAVDELLKIYNKTHSKNIKSHILWIIDGNCSENSILKLCHIMKKESDPDLIRLLICAIPRSPIETEIFFLKEIKERIEDLNLNSHEVADFLEKCLSLAYKRLEKDQTR